MINYQKIDLTGKCSVIFDAHRVDFASIHITWSPCSGLLMKVKLINSVYSNEAKCEVGTNAKLTGFIIDKELSGMEFICERAMLLRSFSKKNKDESFLELYFYQFTPLEIFKTNSNIVLNEYLLPNFIFNGEIQVGDYGDKTSKLDGFSFDYSDKKIVIKQVDEYENMPEMLKNFEISSVITSTLKMPEVLLVNNSNFINWLCLLISGMYGIDIRPQICISYDADNKICKIIIENHRSAPYHQKRTYIQPLCMGLKGWGNFLEQSLPAAINKFEKYHLSQVCNMLTEAQMSMSIFSQIAIVWICLEHFTTTILHESGHFNGKSKLDTEQAPLDDKLNLVNRDLKVLPKAFTQRMKKEKWLRIIRNPLFHQGTTNNIGIRDLWQIYYDLLTATILLLCGVSNYKGKIVVPKIDHPNGQTTIELNG